ncbi:D-alanyl-D-alanine carboxypeptidase/D-alanyl-D-alanine endopeptidase [Edaphobacter dinghuensis]|nr:D-alanyl-D-alanine carboxypeptidase/D-alanyl-D-alanine-endopeptidase [Edaphobacter dinghuensis]
MMRFVGRCAVILLGGMMCMPAGAGTGFTKLHKTHRVKPLKLQVARLLADPAVSRSHWGIAVTKMDGKPIYALNAGQFFQPASNAKLFTTAAAMALLGPETTFDTRVAARGVFDGTAKLTGDLVLIGGGDANLSGRALPYLSPAERPVPPPPAPAALRYLEQMADQVAATGLKVVNGDVVGDDTLFPWEPYAADWAIDDTIWGYGSPLSALTINDNQIKVTVTPGDAAGKPATVAIDPAVPYYTLDVSVTTGAAKSESSVQMERLLGSKVLHIYGAIALDAQPDVEEVAIQDPAEYAAIALKAMLEARGIEVTGVARSEHWDLRERRGFLDQTNEPLDPGLLDGRLGTGCGDAGRPELRAGEKVIASHQSSTLLEDVVATNKVSQNLHAELLLHHLGKRLTCTGSTAQGARVVRSFLENAGIDKDDFVFFDGSGLSGHDLVTPQATAKLLQYASTQPWFEDWKSSLPVGGVDGTLAGRFTQTPLKGHVFAKTGTLGEARALSGYIDCASGGTVIFSIMVDNHAPHSRADEAVMDKIVAAIAETN